MEVWVGEKVWEVMVWSVRVCCDGSCAGSCAGAAAGSRVVDL